MRLFLMLSCYIITATCIKHKQFFKHPIQMTLKKTRGRLFKSALCPRCRHTEKVLNQISEQKKNLEIYSVDVARHPLLSLQSKVLMIPTIILDNKKRLSGFFSYRRADPVLPARKHVICQNTNTILSHCCKSAPSSQKKIDDLQFITSLQTA
ncbi:thioredoxin family protein [Desulfogranum marinum]|uniref:thioredoxin family protein n=1 Tax=Desulfogranum marinum TaxID=453220 RepID=UPI001966A5DA|nr:thioredoxin family protein [Desulfogranum marinum]